MLNLTQKVQKAHQLFPKGKYEYRVGDGNHNCHAHGFPVFNDGETTILRCLKCGSEWVKGINLTQIRVS